MRSAELIPAVVLKRKAVVYVRQSTQSQVMTNLESKRRQYDLVEVTIIDSNATLCLPQIKSGRTDDAIRRERTGRGCARLREQVAE